MSDFMDDDAPLPSDKSNGPRPIPAGQSSIFESADDYNKLKSGLLSLRRWIKSAPWHGLLKGSAPSSDSNVVKLFAGTDNTLRAVFPGGTGAIADKTGAIWNDLQQGGVNVLKYGADPTFTVASSDAIQAAIDANQNVFMPSGTYMLDKPVFIGKKTQLLGNGWDETILRPTNPYTGPSVIVSYDHSLGPQMNRLAYTTALVGSGEALRQDVSTSRAMLDLFQVPQVRLGKKANGTQQPWTIAHHVKVDSGALVPGNLNAWLWAGGAVDPSMSTNTASLILGVDDFGGPMQPKIYFRCGGVTNTYYIATASYSTFAENIRHHFEVSWDGTHLRVFWNGELWTNGAYVPAAGNGDGFTQYPWETLHLGAGQQFYLGGEEPSWGYVKSTIDVVHISNIARHTATFTPPTTKETEDNNTLLLLNFDRKWKYLLIGRTLAFGPGDVYLLPTCSQNGETPLVRLGNFGLLGGGGIKMDFASQSELHDINHQGCTDGWKLTNNGYFSKIHKVVVYGGNGFLGQAWGGRYAISILGGSYIGMDDAHVMAPLGYVFNQANLFGKNINFTVEPIMYYGMMLLGGGGTYSFHGAQADYEGGGDRLRSLLHIETPQAAFFSGCTLATSVGPTGQSPITVVQNGDPGTGFNYAVTFDSCNLQSPDVSTPIFVAGGLQPFFKPIEVRNPYVLSNAPLCATPGVVRDTSQGTLMQGISASDVPARNIAGVFTVSDTSTGSLVTFPAEEDDTDYEVVITPARKTGTPAAGSNRVLTYAKTNAGFTPTLEVAPGSGNSVTFSWFLVRPPV
jgi:hypothetical protein